MITLNEAVIVEGKYDKIKLANFINATIIPTNGFAVFKDRQKLALIKKYAKTSGVIIITDSDSAGAVIRSYLKTALGGGKITNVYIPQIEGRERRKTKNSAEGFLGVEGLSEEIIVAALKKSGVTESDKKTGERITKSDFMKYGLSGKADSSEKRKNLLNFLELPNNLTANAMLDAVNTFYTKQEFTEVLLKWQAPQTKN